MTTLTTAEVGHGGLKSMWERVRLVNGHSRMQSMEGQGTCIAVQVPLLDVEP